MNGAGSSHLAKVARNVAILAGDLPEAKARLEEGLAIRRKLASHDATSADAQRDVSGSLVKLGDVAMLAGNSLDARAHFAEALAIARRLATDNPASAQTQRDLLVSQFKLGAAFKDRTMLREALQSARGLEQAGRLAPNDQSLPGRIEQAIATAP